MVKPNFIFEKDIKPVYEKEDYIIFVGRLSYEKGIMNLLKAIKELDDKIKLLIVGDGPLKDEVIKFIQKNNLKNTKYLGPQRREKVRTDWKSKIFSFSKFVVRGISNGFIRGV